jgi:hypothetical protein
LSAYARFFATRRSLEGGPHLLTDAELGPDEQKKLQELEDRLLGLLHVTTVERPSTLSFDDGPVTIICSEIPPEERGPLGKKGNPNFTKLQQFGDLDALVEAWGHIRVENPTLEARFRLPGEVRPDDFKTHVVLLGGIGWNIVTRRFQKAIDEVPIKQITVPELDTGEIFTVRDAEKGELTFFPEWDESPEAGKELIGDIGLIVRLRNPFQLSRTLTICNGIHSRGVLGAVRCLTDASTRDANERYLAERFPDGTFALLMRVPVFGGDALTPDLQNPETRLYEWAPDEGDQR